MSRTRKYRQFVCDFETTVYEGQVSTEVWASAVVEMYTDKVEIFHSLEDTYKYFKDLSTNIIAYYHNLKFDGNFWLSFLLNSGLTPAIYKTGTDEYDIKFYEKTKMPNNTYLYSISDMGQWYGVTIKVNNYIIELRDSLKLLPFSVKEIGKSFKTKHQKLDIEYTGLRWAGCQITDEEQQYIKNDVLVVKEALEIMFNQKHNKLTIGACCLSEYKSIVGKDFYKSFYPDLTEVYIDSKRHVYDNADSWIRKTYKGGWTYLKKGKENIVFKNGLTADVNSLYPSVMHSESGSRYPVGYPKFWSGDIPDEALINDRYYFVHVKTRFYLKDGYLPFIQIKDNLKYKSTEILDSSDIKDKKTGEYCAFWYDEEGTHDTRVDLYFTCTEYDLFLEHYNVIDFEVIDGCYFESQIGIFDEYIDIYKKQKMESKGALRTLAKLFLNNLYGKMASSTDSSFKYAYLKEDGSVGFVSIEENEKTPGYIAVGSAITGYARNFTIRHAQKNYEHFIYADTDSIHCDCSVEELVGINEHETDFNHWAIESFWDEAIFVRAKTYIEHVTHKDKQLIEPYYDIKCAGMPDRCKKQLEWSIDGYDESKFDFDEKVLFNKLNEEQKTFIKTRRSLVDFKYGLKIYGKLVPKRIKGGIVLHDTYYELRK